MGCIFYLSSRQEVPLPSLFPEFDKVLHVVEYSVLGFLLMRAFYKEYPLKSIAMLKYTALVVAALYALSDEFHQGFVVNRTVDFFDWCADFFGAAFGAWVVFKPRVRSKT